MVRPKHQFKPCSVDGCETDYRSRGMCTKHYARWRADGALCLPRDDKALCKVAGCTRIAYRRDMCRTHAYDGRRPKVSILCVMPNCYKHKHNSDVEYCTYHHMNYMATGDPRKREDPAPCGIKGCDAPVTAKELCANHYAHQWRLSHRSRVRKGIHIPRNVVNGSRLAELVTQARVRHHRTARLEARGIVPQL
jgi:hypothetical protein